MPSTLVEPGEGVVRLLARFSLFLDQKVIYKKKELLEYVTFPLMQLRVWFSIRNLYDERQGIRRSKLASDSADSYPAHGDVFLFLSLMLFADRYFLSQISERAALSIVSSGTLTWVIVYGWSSLTGISEVFVARHYGSKAYDKIAEPVWQMIWVGLFSAPFFFALFFWGAPLWESLGYLTLPEEKCYFRYSMIFGCGYPINTALMGFFIGRGEIRTITYAAIVGNVGNFVLDAVLIFGIDGIIPALEVKGAALATSIGVTLQALFLLFVFLNRENREKFHTHKPTLNMALMKESLQIGGPAALFIVFEVLGWATFYQIALNKGTDYGVAAFVCQNTWALFYCFNDSVHKSIIALSGNLFGAWRLHLIPKLIWSGFKLQFGFLAVMLLAYMTLFDFFLEKQLETLNVIPNDLHPLKLGGFFVVAHLFLDGIRLVLSGLLIAAKDTLFLMISCSLSIWAFLVLPAHYSMNVLNLGPDWVAYVQGIYSFCLVLIVFDRYCRRSWVTSALQSA